ncbi:MAG: PAS domain S-box protein [Leptolyngbyaceae cyanobacterium bins.349]|nr:PAS domain S-box protein [Leptolyngbyaceae cyanobacterium bins.349]
MTTNHQSVAPFTIAQLDLHQILESLPDCVKILDLEGRLCYMNQSGQQLFDIDNFNECHGRAWTDFWQGKDQQAAIAAIAAAKSGNSGKFQGYCPTLSGTPRWWDVVVSPIHNPQGEVEQLLVVSRNITQLKQTEQQLQIYADVVQATQIGIVVWQLETANDPGSFRLLIANAAASEITAVHFETLIGQTMATCFPELLQTSLVQQYLRVIHTQQAIDFGEVPYSADAVQAGIYTLKAFPLPNQCIGLAFENVTTRKALETALSDSEERFRRMTETIQDVFWMSMPAEQRLIYISPAYEQVWGRSRAELYANYQDWIEAIHPDDRPYVQANLQALPQVGQYDVEYRIVRPNGEIRWVRDRGYPIAEPTGEMRQVAGVAEDITDRKVAEAALRDSEAQFRQLADAVPQLVWTALPDGKVDYLNGQWLQYTGIAPEVFYEWGWQQIVHPDDLSGTLTAWAGALQTGAPIDIKHRFRRLDGQWRWHLVRGILFQNDAGQASKWFGTCTDIHESEMREQNARFLEDLGDCLRVSETADDTMGTVARLLGQYLEATRCCFAEIEDAADQWTVSHDYASVAELPSLVGNHPISAYPPDVVTALRAGRSVNVTDTITDPMTAAFNATQYQPLGIRSFVVVPLLRERQWVAALGVFMNVPRAWEEHELLLITTVVERTWNAIENLRLLSELQTSEARFRNMADNAPMMVWVTDPTGYCTYLSRSWYEFSGQTEATGLGFGWLEATHPNDRAAAEAIFLAANERQEAFQLEYRLQRQDGQYRTCIDAAKPWFGANGEFKGFIGSVVDIDDRIQAETALRESEQRFRLMADAVPQIVWITDAEGRVEFFNKQWSDYTGVPYEPLTAAEVAAHFIHPEDSDRTIAAFNDAQRTGSIFTIEHRVRSAAGTYHWFLVRAEPYRDPQTGEIIRWFGASIDIHDRKQAEAELQASEARYRLLAEVIPQFVWITDAAGQNEYVNQRFCDYTGLTAEHMRGLNWLSIIHPDDLERTRDRWLAAVNSGQFYEIEYRFRRHDGTYRWFLGQGIPLEDEPGCIRQWFGTCTDIEPQKQVEQARLRLLQQEQAAREHAENANRIKDEFLAVLSHELRSPLNPILGWAKLLQQGNLDATRTKAALAAIDRNAQLQAQLIDDLLDISRILRGKLGLDAAPVDLRGVIAAALETVHLAAEAKSLHIQTTISPDVGVVIGDAGRLQQVVWNLLSNAVKFTPHNGQIFVTLTQAGTHAQMQVRDTGKGINSDFLPFVFEHFRQEDGATTRKFGGLGLGLAIARQIVELHGGQITVGSPGEGQGATFTVRLPLAPRSNEWPATESASVAVEEGLQGIRILVVDDELDSRDFVTFVLEQAGAIVTSVASGIEALQIMEQADPNLIISDIGMPEMDGYMLMRQMRSLTWRRDSSQQDQHIPAIALTAYAAEFDQQQAIQAGFQQHLAKPVEPDRLVREIVKLLSNR